MWPTARGTYLLQLESLGASTFAVGRLGLVAVVPGWYLYLGSAQGAGGLAARIRHHLRPTEKHHWHLDYLRQAATVRRVCYSTSRWADECLWAAALADMRGCRTPFPGFGASDCNCVSHLFWRRSPPALTSFRKRLKHLCPDHGRLVQVDLFR